MNRDLSEMTTNNEKQTTTMIAAKVNSTNISITITDNETGDITTRFACDNLREFRLLYFDKDGLANIHGKLPLKVIHAPLREWAHNWAETHLAEFEAFITQSLPENTEEEIISLLNDMRSENVSIPIAGTGKRDTTIATHMVQELLRALAMTFTKAVNKPKTTWEIPHSNINNSDSSSIVNWLFRKGGDDGNYN